MSSPNIIMVELGELKVSSTPVTIYGVSHVSASLVVTVYDVMSKVGGIAHIILPDSTIPAQTSDREGEAKFANHAIPSLIDTFIQEGGDLTNAIVRISGGAQLFNFGGGSGNMLNIGARNVTAVKTALTRYALAVDKEDVGGNKPRNIRFTLATGQITITPVGGQEINI